MNLHPFFMPQRYRSSIQMSFKSAMLMTNLDKSHIGRVRSWCRLFMSLVGNWIVCRMMAPWHGGDGLKNGEPERERFALNKHMTRVDLPFTSEISRSCDASSEHIYDEYSLIPTCETPGRRRATGDSVSLKEVIYSNNIKAQLQHRYWRMG